MTGTRNVTGDHVVVVLAAGGSRRLGRPKQLLTRDGETLVHRAVRLAAGTAPRRLLVVLGAHEEAVRAQLGDLDCEAVSNPDWIDGLAGSLRVAAIHLRDNYPRPVLILGCDQPALEAAHLQQLLDGAAHAPSRCAATLHHGAPGIPVVVSPDLFAAATAPLRGDHGLGARLAQLPPGSLSLLEVPWLSLDIDTAEDLRTAIGRRLCDEP